MTELKRSRRENLYVQKKKMQLKTVKDYSTDKRFRLIITQTSRLTPEIKSSLMNNVTVLAGGGRGQEAIVYLGLWIMEATRFASDLTSCQFKMTKIPWFTLGKLNFPKQQVFLGALKCSSALNWKRMLDCLETSFLQVLVPVVLSHFPEVLIHIQPTRT